MIEVIAIIWFLCSLFFTMLGMLTIFHIAKSKRNPMDTSNRINHIRLWWFALTRPELFVDMFPWLKNDELKNIEKGEK